MLYRTEEHTLSKKDRTTVLKKPKIKKKRCSNNKTWKGEAQDAMEVHKMNINLRRYSPKCGTGSSCVIRFR